MKNISQLMKQAKSMQDNLQKAQAEVRSMIVEGVASSGLVKVILGGDKIVKKIEIDQTLISQVVDDKSLLEDMVTIAINDALTKLQNLEKDKMSTATAGIPLPPGMGF